MYVASICNQFNFKMYKAKGEFFSQALLFDSLRFPPVVWWINSTVLHWQLLSRWPESCREKHFSKLDSDGFFALLRSLSYVIKAIVAIYMYLEKNIWCLSYSLSRGVSSLGSARNLAREPHVFESSAQLDSVSGSLR